MIHRAPFGSLERFIGILIEHFAGEFPLWLAPVQVVVVPITDRHVAYAHEVAQALREAGIRVEVDARGERMNAKIRDAETQKVPVILVVGDQEVAQRTVAVRDRRTKERATRALEEVVQDLAARVQARA